MPWSVVGPMTFVSFGADAADEVVLGPEVVVDAASAGAPSAKPLGRMHSRLFWMTLPLVPAP